MATVNGSHVETNGNSRNTALKILIVGAGIGGLTAAIALRKEGHNVHVRANMHASESYAKAKADLRAISFCA